MFENCARGTVVRHENSLHAGAPVEEGEKWLATLWFREVAVYDPISSNDGRQP